MTIIWFLRSLPNAVANELQRQGHTVFESLSISETLALAEQHNSATIVINHDVELAAARVIQQHYPTMQLKVNATARDIIWQLSSGTRTGTVQ